jgi:hypothetical protein
MLVPLTRDLTRRRTFLSAQSPRSVRFHPNPVSAGAHDNANGRRGTAASATAPDVTSIDGALTVETSSSKVPALAAAAMTAAVMKTAAMTAAAGMVRRRVGRGNNRTRERKADRERRHGGCVCQ